MRYVIVPKHLAALLKTILNPEERTFLEGLGLKILISDKVPPDTVYMLPPPEQRQFEFRYRHIVRAYELPAWTNAYYLSLMPYHQWHERQLYLNRWARIGWKVVGKAESRCAAIVAKGWRYYAAKALWWWRRHRWTPWEWGIRLGLLRSPIEADYYQNFRFDPPDLWGTPIRKHEEYLR
jgi:hypothetical protein